MRRVKAELNEEELSYLNKLADKYGLTLKELGMVMGKYQSEKRVQLSLRLTQNEYDKYTTAAKQVGMSYSAFCIYAFNWFVDSGEIYHKDYDIGKVNETQKRDKGTLIFFKNSNDKLKIEEYASRFMVKAASLMRMSVETFIEVKGPEYGIHVAL